MPKDPITAVGTDMGREIFSAIKRSCDGKPIEDIMSACMNMIANCLRQSYGRRSEVEARMRELYGRNMEILLAHYDPVTGRRRSVIPFDQVIRPELLVDQDIFPSLGKPRAKLNG